MKRFLSLFLAAAMILSNMPLSVFAQETQPQEPAPTTVETVPQETQPASQPESVPEQSTGPETQPSTQETVPSETTVPETSETTVPQVPETTVPETSETIPQETEDQRETNPLADGEAIPDPASFFQGITFSSTEVVYPAEITYTVNVLDPASVTQCQVEFSKPNGGGFMVYADVTGSSVGGTLQITDSSDIDVFHVSRVVIATNDSYYEYVQDDPNYPMPQIPQITVKSPMNVVSVTADQTQVQAPGSVRISVKTDVPVTEDSRVFIARTDDINNWADQKYLTYDAGSDSYVCTFEFGPYAEAATYCVSTVVLVADSNTSLWFNSSRNSGVDTLTLPNETEFSILNENSDITPPVLKSVSANVAELTVPGTIVFTAVIEDDLSGTNNVSGNVSMSYTDGTSPEQRYLSFARSGDSNTFTATVTLDEYAPNGVLRLDNMYVCDAAGNENNYCSVNKNPDNYDVLPQEIEVNIVNPNPNAADREAPKLLSITADQTEVTAPGSITLKAEVTDNVSGISYVRIFIREIKDGVPGEYCGGQTMTLNPVSGLYEATMEYNEYAPNCQYFVHNIDVCDNANNETYYYSTIENEYTSYPLPNDLIYTVTNSDPSKQDFQNPVLKSIHFEPAEVMLPGSTTVSAEITDDASGVKSAYFYLEETDNPNVPSQYVELTKDEATGLYTAVLEFNNVYAPSKFYHVGQFIIEDNAGHDVTYSGAPDEAWAEPLPNEAKLKVTNPVPENVDLEPPVLNSVTSNAAEFTMPGYFKLFADVSDEASGVEQVNIKFTITDKKTGESRTAYRTMEKDPSGLFFTKEFFNKYAASCDLEVEDVTIADKADHVSQYCKDPNVSYNQKPLPENLIFEIKNPDPSLEDREDPVLHSITADRTEVQTPGSIKITLDITDDASGVQNVSLFYSELVDGVPSDDMHHADVTLDPVSGKYVSTISFDEFAPTAEYYIYNIDISDVSGRNANYYSSLDGEIDLLFPNELTFKVVNPDPSKEDKNAPVLDSFSFSPSQLTVPGSVVMEMTASDDASGIESAEIFIVKTITATGEEQYERYEIRDLQNGDPVRKTMNFSEYDAGCTMVVDYVTFYDNAGHEVTYCDPVSRPDATYHLPSHFEVKVVNPDPSKEDLEPPKLLSIQADQKTLEAPGQVVLTFDILEEKSGFQYGSAMISSVSTGRSYRVPVRFNEETSQYEAVFKFDEYAIADEYALEMVSLTDNAEHESWYRTAGGQAEEHVLPNELSVTVTNDKSDARPPVLNRVEVSSAEVTVPGFVKFYVYAEDDVSGIRNVNLCYMISYNDGENYEQIHTRLVYNEQLGCYVGAEKFNEYAPSAVGFVSELNLSDRAGNYIEYVSSRTPSEYSNPLPQEVDFKIVNPNPEMEDLLPAQLVSVKIDQDHVMAPGSFMVSCDIQDDVSGVSFAHITLGKKGVPDYDFADTNLRINPETGLYEAHFSISKYEADGEIYVKSLHISDHSGKSIQYHSMNNPNAWGNLLPNEASVAVTNSNPEMQDVNPPELLSLSAGNTKVTAPGALTIELDIKDDASGFDHGSVEYLVSTKNENIIQRHAAIHRDPDTGKYYAVFGFSKFQPNMKNNISRVMLTDKAGHSIVYGSVDSPYLENAQLPNELYFEVTSLYPELQDFEGPVVHCVKADKTTVQVPGSVKLTAEVEDDASGVFNCNLRLRSSSDRANAAPDFVMLHRNPSTGLFEGELYFDEYEPSGELVLEGVYLEDRAGHNVTYADESYADGALPNQLSIQIVNNNTDSKDQEAPRMLSIAADLQTMTIGDHLNITAEITDNASGVREVSAHFELLTGEYGPRNVYDVKLQLDPASGKYTGACIPSKYSPNGILHLESVYVSDNAGNGVEYSEHNSKYPLPQEINVKFMNNNPEAADKVAPTLISVKADKTEVAAPGKVKITVKAKDDVSGVKECSLTFAEIGPNNNYKNLSLYKNQQTGDFEGWLEFDAYTPSTTFVLETAYLSDFTGYGSSYTNRGSEYAMSLPSYVTVKVTNSGTPDQKAPVLVSLEADKTELTAPDAVKISAKVTDDVSGVRTVSARFVALDQKGQRSERTVYMTYNENTDLYEGVLHVKEFENIAGIELYQMVLEDKANNVNVYGSLEKPLPKAVTVKVHHAAQDQLDTTVPEIVSVRADKLRVTAPGQVKLQAEILEEGSGVADVNLIFRENNSYFYAPDYSVNLTYNESTGLYEGVLDFGAQQHEVEFDLVGAKVTDNAGNDNAYGYDYNGMGKRLPNELSVLVFNYNAAEDEETPVLQKIFVDQTEIAAPGKVKITAVAEDAGSGILDAVASVHSAQDYTASKASRLVTLKPNAKTGNLEGWLQIREEDAGSELIIENVTLRDQAGNFITYYSVYGDMGMDSSYIFNNVLIQVLEAPKGQWQQVGSKWRYVYEDGTYAKNVFERIGGETYYFDANGYMATGWRTIEGKRYCFNNSGHMLKGLVKMGSYYYCFAEDGHMLTGFTRIGDFTHYFDAKGHMLTGWQTIEGKRYCFNNSGRMLKGLVKMGSYYYCFAEDGHMLTGFTKIGDFTHYFDAKGHMLTGWQTIEGKRYCFNNSGKMLVGYMKIGSYYYCFAEDGHMITGLHKIGSNTYFFDSKGHRATGWQTDGTYKYYFDENGLMKRGWLVVGSDRYCFDKNGHMMVGIYKMGSYSYCFAEDGRMVKGWHTIDGKRYCFDTKGHMLIGMQKIGSYIYGFAPSGQMLIGVHQFGSYSYCFDAKGHLVNGWQTVDGYRYYFDTRTNRMVKGWKDIGGKRYCFNSKGHMLTDFQKIGSYTYYFGTDGVLRKGWVTIGKDKYCFNNSGHMLVGFCKVGSYTFYFAEDGKMATGWKTINGSRYCFNPKGWMLTGWQNIGSYRYCFTNSGKMLIGMHKIGTYTYCFNARGQMVKGWQTVGGKKYYFDAKGHMLTGRQNIDGKDYIFSADGVLIG